jgi:hypothetical protein
MNAGLPDFYKVQHTKTRKINQNVHKIYQMEVNRPNDLTIYKHLSLQYTPKFTHFGIFGLKMYHLAILHECSRVKKFFLSVLATFFPGYEAGEGFFMCCPPKNNNSAKWHRLAVTRFRQKCLRQTPQGCQIFLGGTIYQNGNKCNKRSQSIPDD